MPTHPHLQLFAFLLTAVTLIRAHQGSGLKRPSPCATALRSHANEAPSASHMEEGPWLQDKSKKKKEKSKSVFALPTKTSKLSKCWVLRLSQKIRTKKKKNLLRETVLSSQPVEKLYPLSVSALMSAVSDRHKKKKGSQGKSQCSRGDVAISEKNN